MQTIQNEMELHKLLISYLYARDNYKESQSAIDKVYLDDAKLKIVLFVLDSGCVPPEKIIAASTTGTEIDFYLTAHDIYLGLRQKLKDEAAVS